MSTFGNSAQKYVDIMLDLETLGTTPGCKILAIGAAQFNYPGTKHFCYLTANVNSQPQLVEDSSTLAWWANQSDAARKEAFSGVLPLSMILCQFNEWLEIISDRRLHTIRIWGKGKDFDEPILRAAYESCNLVPNWDSYYTMCFRHMYEDMKETVPAPLFQGVRHSALADARHQAKHADLIIAHAKEAGMMTETFLSGYSETLARGEKLHD